MRAVLPMLIAGCLAAADSYPVQSVGDDGRVVVSLRGIPVSLALAHVQFPNDPAQRAAAITKLRLLASGSVELFHDSAFGSDQGTGKVAMRSRAGDVGEQLALAGLVSVEAATTTAARLAAIAQDKAKRANTGIWAAATPVAVAAVNPPVATSKPASGSGTGISATTISSGAEVVSELGSSYFYPPSHRAVAAVNPQRLIRYNSAEAAMKAGKHAAPQDLTLPTGTDRSTADSIFETGRGLMAQAMAMGASPERDRLYGQAFPVLAKSVELYNNLAEKHPDDSALLEQLRVANQMRFAAMKYKRT